MTRLPALTARQVMRALERGGFVQVRVRGSHYRFRHPERPTPHVTVPFHRKDLDPIVVRSIVRQAGLAIEEFRKLL
ncbi:MAG: type II toxin-antitoxin system HicA family toxin [Pseudomonadota bacterium]